MSKKTKILIILINLILLIVFISNTVCGASLINKFDDSIKTNGAEDLKTTGGKIVGIIQVIGTLSAICMLIILGIKYIIGTVEEKAEYKKTMIPYLVGTILIFGFSNITQFIYKWTGKMTSLSEPVEDSEQSGAVVGEVFVGLDIEKIEGIRDRKLLDELKMFHKHEMEEYLSERSDEEVVGLYYIHKFSFYESEPVEFMYIYKAIEKEFNKRTNHVNKNKSKEEAIDYLENRSNSIVSVSDKTIKEWYEAFKGYENSEEYEPEKIFYIIIADEYRNVQSKEAEIDEEIQKLYNIEVSYASDYEEAVKFIDKYNLGIYDSISPTAIGLENLIKFYKAVYNSNDEERIRIYTDVLQKRGYQPENGEIIDDGRWGDLARNFAVQFLDEEGNAVLDAIETRELLYWERFFNESNTMYFYWEPEKYRECHKLVVQELASRGIEVTGGE